MTDTPRAPKAVAGAASPAMPLSMSRSGQTVELADVHGGVGLRRHLAEMGIGCGSRFTVETALRSGPFVVRAMGTRLVLGRAMVDRMRVRPSG
jgi:Fe2+ transport system protein FeoA